MKISKIILFSVLIVTFSLLELGEVAAQCQACKSTVESNLADGGTTGIGLNTGILYLLSMPYLMAVSIAAVWYFKFRNKKHTI